ncbi:MAG: SpoIID/LytB domain-containing protein [Muricoprocola sp.]
MRKNLFLVTVIVLLLFVYFQETQSVTDPVEQEAFEQEAFQTEAFETEDFKIEAFHADEISLQNIRVLISSDNYQSQYHDSIKVESDQGAEICFGDEVLNMTPDEVFTVTADMKKEAKEEPVIIYPATGGNLYLPELIRAKMGEGYQGHMEIYFTDQGIILINELELEEYLKNVVPSEMPSDYPEEALKAQAICARTYALKRTREGEKLEGLADLDDSVSYQVYHNQGTSEQTNRAVEETKGMVLEKDGELIDALYYSTSCGLDLRLDLSDEAVMETFMTTDQIKAAEYQETWFRWKTRIWLSSLPGEVEELNITERRKDGAVIKMQVRYSSGEEPIEGEYNIREYLAQASPEYTVQDGSKRSDMELLPSSFFIMKPYYEGEKIVAYDLFGGGYGHGIGLSQNGAKCMAEDGFACEDILRAYYGEGVYCSCVTVSRGFS